MLLFCFICYLFFFFCFLLCRINPSNFSFIIFFYFYFMFSYLILVGIYISCMIIIALHYNSTYKNVCIFKDTFLLVLFLLLSFTIVYLSRHSDDVSSFPFNTWHYTVLGAIIYDLWWCLQQFGLLKCKTLLSHKSINILLSPIITTCH